MSPDLSRLQTRSDKFHGISGFDAFDRFYFNDNLLSVSSLGSPRCQNAVKWSILLLFYLCCVCVAADTAEACWGNDVLSVNAVATWMLFQ